MAPSSNEPNEVEEAEGTGERSDLAGLRAVVVGLGPMGRGIARVFDRAGAEVRVVDGSPRLTEDGLARIRAEAEADGESLRSVVGAPLAEAVADASVVVEAVVENLEVKRELLAQIAAHGPDDLLVASNTSSLSVAELGRAFGDPSRVVGLHFFNPATKMRLVEVVAARGTGDASLARARRLTEALGKTPVVCRDSPNFLVNRICRPLYYEAQLLATQGVEPAAVDAVACGALGHPMGPLTLLDFTGLHTHLASSETALREFGDPRYRPIPLARSLVRGGMTGRAAGRGFYDYAVEKPRAALARVVRRPAPERPALRIDVAGPDATTGPVELPPPAAADAGTDAPAVTVYRCRRRPTEADAAAVRELAEGGGRVVVDSSDGHWLDLLPRDAGWVCLHRSPAGDLFAEVVVDEVAGLKPLDPVALLLDALGAAAVEVPALPGLVADRLAHCMINEAVAVVEEGTSTPGDVDLALTLGMNHPRGPFEELGRHGAATVYAALRSMAGLFGDPRYRPAPYLRRQAAGERR
ncbi:3-hydroxyacyl-CoA dehydrogenase NAD-binding domain-containing protein [Streptomyces odontomachi]|uniref:3-hydroxyacyl-CoA dehydrogenase NAD-binding domain-containing protein n=1 Tax=Streptomyces odontomachi TaxID=2944940 RepID=UPI00210EEF76|nr:3-hydroxyacyl-CoA dehydrogenase NAD-binding domain-containing protein [Streptomyces sp. ODS25]